LIFDLIWNERKERKETFFSAKDLFFPVILVDFFRRSKTRIPKKRKQKVSDIPMSISKMEKRIKLLKLKMAPNIERTTVSGEKQ